MNTPVLCCVPSWSYVKLKTRNEYAEYLLIWDRTDFAAMWNNKNLCHAERQNPDFYFKCNTFLRNDDSDKERAFALTHAENPTNQDFILTVDNTG